MQIAENIRGLYMPVQPAVRQTATDVSYREIAPHPALQQIIYCYWLLQADAPLDNPFYYRVVADGCIDIYFNLHNSNESFAMGFCKKYTEFELPPQFRYAGIRFLPTMFPHLFHVNAALLSNRYEELSGFAPATAAFIREHLYSRMDDKQLANMLDKHFLSLLPTDGFNFDSRLYNAIDIILKHQGVLNIEKDINAGISQRQLRRMFDYYIGDSIKTFSKVVRFQNILRAKPSARSLRENKLFFDAGYYDQAHFIKEFKTFYGVTPSKAFGH